jgi:predicted transposase/invertase (TIGR01784 family)
MTAPISPYINPFTDFGFKRLFGSESYKELLIDFLNTILPSHHQIQDLTYRQNERLGKTESDRKAIFDLYCQSSSGEHFIVEIQKAKQKYFRDRSVFYASFPIQEQALTGEWNLKLSAVYMVGILDFVFDEDKDDTERYFHQVKSTEITTNRIFFDKLTFLCLELPKFKKSEDELTTHFEKWLYAFKHLASLQDRPAKLQERIFTRLFEAANIAKFTPTERIEYEDSLKPQNGSCGVENGASAQNRFGF